MDYTAWSMAYWEEASRVQERMAQVRQEGLPPSPQEEALQRRRLSILYEMYLDCVHTAKDLGRRAQRRAPRFIGPPIDPPARPPTGPGPGRSAAHAGKGQTHSSAPAF